jgi:hypothetical protein
MMLWSASLDDDMITSSCTLACVSRWFTSSAMINSISVTVESIPPLMNSKQEHLGVYERTVALL